MSNVDLSTALVDAGGGQRRATPAKVAAPRKTTAKPKAKAPPPMRGATKPITVHFPQSVRDQLKILAVEQGTNLHTMVGEGLNMLFAKYGKPEIAPSTRKA